MSGPGAVGRPKEGADAGPQEISVNHDDRSPEFQGRYAAGLPAGIPGANSRRETTIGFRAPDAAIAAGITYRQLDYWDRTDLLKPSLRSGGGSGSKRLYSFSDVQALTVIRRLLGCGCSLQQIRVMLCDFLAVQPGDAWIPPEWTVELAPGVRITVTDEAVPG